MAEVNASITQLFKDKLKPGQTQTPVYPKTIGAAVEVPRYKGDSSNGTETLSIQLGKKFGYQVTLVCPNNWKYLYTFPDFKNFEIWKYNLCSEVGATENTLFSIISGDAWSTLNFSQEELDEFDVPYLSAKNILSKIPLFSVTNTGEEPIAPPDVPTLNPWLRVNEFQDNYSEAQALESVVTDLEEFTLQGGDLDGGAVVITCYAPPGNSINFSPYTGNSPSATEDGDVVRYANVLTLTNASDFEAICSNAGKTIKLYTIDEQSDDVNFIKIEYTKDSSLVLYLAVKRAVTDSPVVNPTVVSELPVTVSLSNIEEESYTKISAFTFKTKDVIYDLTLTVSKPSGLNIPFYLVITELNGNKIKDGYVNVSSSCTLGVYDANNGVKIYVSTIPMKKEGTNWVPDESTAYPTASTTTNNFGTISVTGVTDTAITVAKLNYTYKVNQDEGVRVSTSVRDLYLPVESTDDSNHPYQFITEPITSVSIETINPYIATGNAGFKNADVKVFGFKITLENVPESEGNTFYNYYFSKVTSGTSYSIIMDATNAYHLFLRTAIKDDGSTVYLDNTNKYQGAFQSKNCIPIKAENGALKETSIQVYYFIENPYANNPAADQPGNSFTDNLNVLTNSIQEGNLCVYCEHSPRANTMPLPIDNFVSRIDNVSIIVHNEPKSSEETPSESLFAAALYNSCNPNTTYIQSKSGISEDEVYNITYLPPHFMQDTIGDSVGNPFTDVDLSNYINLKAIGEYAFAGCSNLEEVSLPDSIIRIGAGAFKECSSLESINIPTNMKVIKPETFYKTSIVTDALLQSVVIPDNITTIGDRAFAENTNVDRIVIPASVTSIGEACFMNCTNLSTVVFSENSNLHYLGAGAFSGCSSLLSIAIPNGVENLEEGTFYNCSSLTTVDLGTGISVIGGLNIFTGCTSITDLYLRATHDVDGSLVGVVWVRPIGVSFFTFEDEVKQNMIIHVPSEVLEWYQSNEFWLAQVGDDSSRIVAIDE